MENNAFLIYGAGGFAREVAWLAEVCAGQGGEYRPVAFIDDSAAIAGSSARALNGLPVLSLDQACERFPGARFAVGIGNPKVREGVANKAVSRGLRLASLTHPRVEMSRWVEIGEGALICAGNIVSTNIRMGKGVLINLDCTIGHDVILDDYVTINPGVHVSGNVHLGKRVYVGTGAVIINGTGDKPLVIGDDAVIGAGGCVTRSIPAGVTAVGVPAKPLAPREPAKPVERIAAPASVANVA
jgi:sugar O-acyltransferase (sialic acid O-acetyltransferase NeuD family)